MKKIFFSLVSLFILGNLLFLVNCSCNQASVEVEESPVGMGAGNSNTNGTSADIYNDNTIASYSNYHVVNYEAISNYVKLNDIPKYKYYVLATNRTFKTFRITNGIPHLISNYTRFSFKTNYYFTNSLMTNTNFYLLSNTFQTQNSNFIAGFYSNSCYLISDNNNILGYSKH